MSIDLGACGGAEAGGKASPEGLFHGGHLWSHNLSMLVLLFVRKEKKLPSGSQPPFGKHLLWHGVLHRLQVNMCSTVDLHGLLGTSCLTIAFTMRCRGNLCSGFWSISLLFFYTDLGVCRTVLLKNSHSSLQLLLCSSLSPFYDYPRALPPLLMGSGFACGSSVMELAGIGSIRCRGNFWLFLTEVTPCYQSLAM